jgi:hypothetical protein
MALILAGSLCAAPAFASRVHRAPTSGGKAHARSAKKGAKVARTAKTTKATKATKTKGSRSRGQQAIAPERVTEIQQALIREKYLDGEATGQWDQTTIAAMQKFQADQGWQTKLMPDSRALKKLGLGADYSNALNAQSAGFAAPGTQGTTPADQASGFATAARVNR